MHNKNRLTGGTLIMLLVLLLFWNFNGIAQQKQGPATEEASIGEIDFRVSCDEAVQEDFDRALGMLHHMMYVAARNAFKDIAEKAPNCAMAYWGIATTRFQPLWGTRPGKDDLQKGWREIGKAHKLVESERERYLIEATAGFFREPETADFRTRIERWVEGVENAYNAYPDDVDIAAFYGLSLLAKAQSADDIDPLNDEAERVLRDVFEQVPTHPGAIHYSIHATDVSGRARNALDMVKVYGKIAPDVPHALHMPAHIYVRLGDWPKVIEWNDASAQAALKYPVNNAVSHHYLHAIDYLVYAYLQRGEDKRAAGLAEEAREKEQYQSSLISAFHLSVIPARLAVERNNWKRATALQPRTPAYLPWDDFPWAEGLNWYARGLGAIHTGDIDAAREADSRLKSLREKARNTGADDMATYIEIDRRVLAGRIAHAQGDTENAVELTRSAAELEAGIEKHPITPGALLPPYEALGNLFMDLDHPADAFEAYQASDEIWPGRYKTILGAARAAKRAGKQEAAKKYYEKLLTITGDSERTTLREARQYISQPKIP